MGFRTRVFSLLACLLTLTSALPADAGVFILRLRGHNIVAVSTCAGDGLAGAPSGTPQFASMLTGLTFRSGCAVAGVDYRVGPPEAQTFAAPSTLGGNWDATNHRYRCDGQTNPVVDGIDFATGGGTFYITGGCNGLVIKNSKIRYNWGATGGAGAPCSMAINQDNSGNSGITLQNVEIDGGGATGSANCAADPSGDGETIQLSGNGPKVLDYVYIHDVDQHFVTVGGPAGVGPTSTYTMKHSVLTRSGFQQGAHANGTQWSGAQTTSTDVEWNTLYDPQPDVTSGNLTATCTSGQPTIAVSLPGTNQGSFRVNQHLTGGCFTGTALVTNVSDPATGPPDVVTLTIDRNATSTGSTTVASPDMYPVGLVIGFRYNNDGGNSSLANAKFDHNTFAGPGPIKGMTYNLACAGSTGTFEADGNFYAPSNTSGGMFNITTGACPNRSGSGAARMDTGANVPVP